MAIANQMTNMAQADIVTTTAVTRKQSYKRIMVFLNGTEAAEIVLRKATNLAKSHDASLVIICRNCVQASRYVETLCQRLRNQRIQANGYLVAKDMREPTVWLVQSEKVDALITTQHSKGWFGQWMGTDTAAFIQQRAGIDVYTVEA